MFTRNHTDDDAGDDDPDDDNDTGNNMSPQLRGNRIQNILIDTTKRMWSSSKKYEKSLISKQCHLVFFGNENQLYTYYSH